MIQVIERALSILEFVAGHGKEPVRLIQIAENAGLSQPTTANIVKTLVDKNYLEQAGRTIGYRLGIAAYQLSENPSFDQDLIAASKEPMEKLTQQLNETSLLAVIRNNKRVILRLEECDQVLLVKTAMVADLYDTSTGRLLMAYLPPKQLDALLKAIGLPSKKIWPGAETKEGLDRSLEQIRKDEFVQTLSKYHTVGFAVPIYKAGKVIAAISIFVPESRYTDLHKEKISRSISNAARAISKALK